MSFIAGYSGAQVGAVYIAEGGRFRRFGGYAIPPGQLDELRPGDGLLGQAVRDNRSLRIRDVPAGYLPIVSAVGQGTRCGVAHRACEHRWCGAGGPGIRVFWRHPRGAARLAVALLRKPWRSRYVPPKIGSVLQELLQETQQQAEELQAGQEELRVSNEELEEQGRALRESQANLETQQAELEQINSQLEEQTQLLENQKDALAKAHEVLTARSEELQKANEYKSEFLANMSHELRTPLNSTLILAKAAGGQQGWQSHRSTGEVRTDDFGSAGNDLLMLINDVLDLSRIEAGKVELSIETTIDRIRRRFSAEDLPTDQLRRSKSASIGKLIEPGVPESIETDPQRLGQILKNLLSNAFKFTEHGRGRLSSVGAERRASSHSRCAIPAWASPRISKTSSSRPSGRPTAASTASSAVPGSGCRYRATWRPCWAAASQSKAKWVLVAFLR